LFKDPDYTSFASQLVEAMEQTELPEIQRVEKRNPDIAALHRDLSSKLDRINLDLCNKLKTVQESVTSFVGPWANGAQIEVNIRPRNTEHQSPAATESNHLINPQSPIADNPETTSGNQPVSIERGLYIYTLLLQDFI
jgi:hypothetical protein